MSSGPFPPLDFSLFGWRGWTGARWVGFFEGEAGKPVWSVTLDHHRADPVLVLVKTAPKERWDRLMASIPELGAREFASDLVPVLVDLARPQFEESVRARYNRSIWPFARAQGHKLESWEQAQWSIDDKAVPSRIFRFGHAWTGVTLGAPGYYIGVTAFDLDDTEVELAQVSGGDYNFDFTVPFLIDELQAQIPERPDTSAIYLSKNRHPDHDRVLAAEQTSTS